MIKMFNHSSYNQIEASFTHSRFEANTIRDIEVGEQLFVNYATHEP